MLNHHNETLGSKQSVAAVTATPGIATRAGIIAFFHIPLPYYLIYGFARGVFEKKNDINRFGSIGTSQNQPVFVLD